MADRQITQAALSPLTAQRGRLHALRARVIVLLIAASLAPLAAIGAGAWLVFSKIIATRTEEHLQTIVSDHAGTIDLFLQERLMALAMTARLYDKEQLRDPAALKRVFDQLNASYAQSFQDLGVIEDTGQHLAYAGPYDLMGKNYQGAPWFEHVRKEGRYISDVFLGFRNVPHFVIAVRLDEAGGRFWILRASVNSEVFDDLVSRGRLGASGDCFVLNRGGLLQTPAKDGTPVLSQSDVAETVPLDQVATVPATTASSRAVFRTMKWINNGQWLVVAQQDQAEVRAPVRAALARGMVVFAAGVLVIVLTSLWTTRFLFRLLEKAIEQKEKLNLQFLQAGKLASVGELATGVAHEINNPLAIIYSEQTNLSDLLGEMDQADARVAELSASVAQTKKQVERCKTITHKMLQFGRQGRAGETKIDPAPELREMIHLLQPHARVNNVELCLEVEDALPQICIDPGEFQQVLTNLINNAMQAIHAPRGGILVSAWREGKELRVAVADTGIGIPEDRLALIFEPFYTTKPVGKGTGLGLSVCYGILTKWRGQIHVESGPGGGAVFTIQLPAADI